jgi:hypothetical protein
VSFDVTRRNARAARAGATAKLLFCELLACAERDKKSAQKIAPENSLHKKIIP